MLGGGAIGLRSVHVELLYKQFADAWEIALHGGVGDGTGRCGKSDQASKDEQPGAHVSACAGKRPAGLAANHLRVQTLSFKLPGRGERIQHHVIAFMAGVFV